MTRDVILVNFPLTTLRRAAGRDPILTLIALTLLLASCTSTPARCQSGDFSIGSSHMTNILPGTFVVRELRGRFIPQFLDGEPGDWIHPENTIRFQLNGSNGVKIMVPVAPDGTFHVPNLRAGRYCFHTASEGLQGYEGVIVIDPRADDARGLTIDVQLGV